MPQIKTFSCRRTKIQKYKNLEIQKSDEIQDFAKWRKLKLLPLLLLLRVFYAANVFLASAIIEDIFKLPKAERSTFKCISPQ